MLITHPRPITISIVSHGQQALILPLLEQLDQLCAAWIESVVLTINIPERDLVDPTAYRFPIRLIANQRARGFGANHNTAFSYCTSQWFLVLNPDIRIASDVLTPLLDQASDCHGLLGLRIIEPGRPAPEPHRNIVTPWEILRRGSPTYVAPDHPAWIPGMFMLLRTHAYRELRGFDERYFMYGEDFDLCARLRLAGWHLQIREDLVVEHQAQRASHRRFRHALWHLNSLIKVWLSSSFWRYRRLLQRIG